MAVDWPIPTIQLQHWHDDSLGDHVKPAGCPYTSEHLTIRAAICSQPCFWTGTNSRQPQSLG